MSGWGCKNIRKDSRQNLDNRSLQAVLARMKKKTDILKQGSVNPLRHSFAIHLIKKETDETIIQEPLGHNDIKTTLPYLYTSNRYPENCEPVRRLETFVDCVYATARKSAFIFVRRWF